MNKTISHCLTLAALLFAASPCFADDGRRVEPLAWPEQTREMRPWAYWWWMGSAVDKPNITRELQRYHDAGLGGVHIIPIYGAKGFESNYISYLSPKWMEMMGWAVSEARRLDMDVDMTTGTGWCFGGGPDVGEREGNANVVWKTYDVAAGAKLAEKFNAQQIQALVAFTTDGKSEELTGKISADGSVDWTAPAAAKVYSVSQKLNSQKVKRPAPGGEGPMLNLIYPDAMKVFLRSHTEAFDKYTGPKPRAQYHDSYEYKSDWSPDFFAQFEKHRGYRLQDELPALFGGGQDDHAARVKCDYRETVSEIMVEDSLPQWVKWSHQRGFITRNEAHGSPGNLLDLYAAADVPETEMFNKDRNKLISKFASSAAHVTGKKLVASETGTWLAEHFTETLAETKYLLDDVFLSGVNHVFYHGTCYSPDEAGWPGWHFYASLEMNPRNSIWRDAPALNAYVARCQSVLQSGAPDNDILIYWPIHDFWMQPGRALLPHLTVHARDWFEAQPIGRTAKELWERGYAFDYVSDAQLKTAKVVKEVYPSGENFGVRSGPSTNYSIQMPGAKYQVIVVPECKYIPFETFKTLLSLAEKGAQLVFVNKLPDDISGVKDLADQRKEFKKIISEFQCLSTNYGGASVCKIGNAPLEISPSWWINGPREHFTYYGLAFVRRSSDYGYDYFIVNKTNTVFNDRVDFGRFLFRVDGWGHWGNPVILDPMTGKVGVPEKYYNRNSKRMQIDLKLDPGQSVIVRILHPSLTNDLSKLPKWTYWQTNGQPVEITGQWNVKFVEGGPTLPADFQTAALASWATFPDTNAQSFAGTAKYQITFDAPRRDELHESQTETNTSGTRVTRPSEIFYLNLGDVRQSARVKVNGKDFGTLITPPFRVVVGNLKPTGNVLEVEVTNVSANRIRDLDRRGVKWKNFHDINFVNIDYKPFDASNWPLADSGLLGPVTLTPITAGDLRN